jgi:hypothetical protein
VPPAGWFIDADVLGLYRVLYAARRTSFNDVFSGLTPDFPVQVDMEDTRWMPLLKGRDLAVITKDRRQRFREEERQAIQDNTLGCFAIRARKHINTWEQTRLILAHWDDMEAKWDSTPRPFVFTVTRTGGIRRVL